MQSQFVNVLEPYNTSPFINRVRPLAVEHSDDTNAVAAVAVELADGRTDILISCERSAEVTVEGGIRFSGAFGMIRLVDDEVKLMRMIGGTLLTYGDTKLTAESSALQGKVVRIDASDAGDNRVFLDPPLPQDANLVGRTIHFVNDQPMDTSYKIVEVTADGISTGDITIVRGLVEGTDLASGYTYLVNPGDEYVLPVIVGRG
jgi:hypothetical protein